MRSRGPVRAKLTYANVMATLAFFLALGGGAFAAFHLPADSVKSKNIVNGQVKARDLAKPQTVHSAGLPDHNGGGCNMSANGWESEHGNPVGYYRDIDGIVHLTGVALDCGSSPLTLFGLTQGFRPTESQSLLGVLDNLSPKAVSVNSTGEVQAAASSGQTVSLYGLSFRCGPSGQSGCP